MERIECAVKPIIFVWNQMPEINSKGGDIDLVVCCCGAGECPLRVEVSEHLEDAVPYIKSMSVALLCVITSEDAIHGYAQVVTELQSHGVLYDNIPATVSLRPERRGADLNEVIGAMLQAERAVDGCELPVR